MSVSPDARPLCALLFLLASVPFAANGCSRAKYRIEADREAYGVISERALDSRSRATDYSIEIDPRSRYFDSSDPDCPPMPPDDPVSHRYMHVVDGMKGWKHYHDDGHRVELENPAWREALAEYVDIGEDGSVKLNIDSALKLAYVHSPSHQNQLETLYLSALDVTTERFRLDTQFFGGYGVKYAHNGSLIPPSLGFDPESGRYVVNPAIDGVESNRRTVGRPSAADPAIQARRRFATGSELLAGFANSFVVEFTGANANLSASLANFTFMQPLLRGAGKDVALEQLTFVERTLLANLRAYNQFRQGFYTQVTIGELGVTGPQRGGGGTRLTIFPGQGGVGGYLGLLQELQQIRNTEDNLSLQLRTLAQLEAHFAAGVIDLVQVDQFRQSIENERANLLQNRNGFERSLDGYKTGALGLPPDLPIELDESLIRQFQFVTREATAVQDSIAELQVRVGEQPDDAGVEAIRQILIDLFMLVDPVRRQLDDIQADFDRMEEAVPARQQSMTDVEKNLFDRDREQLREASAELGQEFEEAKATQRTLRDGLAEDTKDATVRGTVVLLGDFLRLVQGSILVQARARLEAVTVETIDLTSGDAFEIALASRLDFMNARAALVDSWRLIRVNADALQSVLNVTANGDVRTGRNNPVSFRAATGTLRAGVEFDAPLTRLVERNNYRESLINYQRSRRDFIQSRDSLHLGLRVLLREIEQLRTNLEIQRRAVAIAIRRVDLTRAALNAPVPPPLPGQPPAQFGPTAAINSLSALSSLRDTQNNFLNVWLTYYAARMRLSRELGIMFLDSAGRWIDPPPPSSNGDEAENGNRTTADDGPPPIPAAWIELGNSLPDESTGAPQSDRELPGASIDRPPVVFEERPHRVATYGPAIRPPTGE